MRAASLKVTQKLSEALRLFFRAKHQHKPVETSMEWAGDGPEKVRMVMNRERSSVFINPYTGDILGKMKSSDRLMGFMKDLHGNLLAGKIGTKFVELSSCWVMMLMTTGLIMWWPRGKVGVMGTLIPRLKTNKRLFWRDCMQYLLFTFHFSSFF